MKERFQWEVTLDTQDDGYWDDQQIVQAYNNAVLNQEKVQRWYDDSGIRQIYKYRSLSQEEYDLLTEVIDTLSEYFMKRVDE